MGGLWTTSCLQLHFIAEVRYVWRITRSTVCAALRGSVSVPFSVHIRSGDMRRKKEVGPSELWACVHPR